VRHPRLLAAVLGASLLAAGALAGSVTTRASAGGSTGTVTSTTATSTTAATATSATTATGATTTGATTTGVDPSQAIAAGVSIGGVQVGGMTQAQAAAAVWLAYQKPISLQVGQRHFQATPRQLGFHVYLTNPVRVAFGIGRTSHAAPGDIPVVTRLAGTGLRSYLRYLQRTFHRDAINAKYVRKGTSVKVIADVWGRDVNKVLAAPALLAALRDVSRAPVVVPTTVVKPTVPARKVGPALIVDRGLHHVTLWIDGKLVRQLPVAVGQPAYPTPVGAFAIVDMQRNPTWTPPNSAWAAGEKPIGPGPGNPLGTRWMGLSAPGVGLHGTPDAASIGYSASHGCIRMRIPDAEWLFDHVVIGTPVWIID
jgi:lipoprotein-anchoring transpeptidase ErfK/SrfK